MARGDHHQVVVLGAGLAGLAASSRLHGAGVDVAVLEREDRVGGLAGSVKTLGFTFDHGPHVSFTKRDDIRKLFADAVQGRFREATTELLNLWRGHWIPHPAQSHLHGLPPQLVADCIMGLVEATRAPPPSIGNYAEWCVANLGQSFSEEFTFRYTRKYWTAEASAMTADWVGPRVHAPPLREMILGALAPQRADQHYIASYRYPLDGGYVRYVESVRTGQVVRLGEAVSRVLPAERLVVLSDGQEVGYERLVSSLPLPELLALVNDVPPNVRSASAKLRCSSLVLLEVAVDRHEGFPAADWMYFYDEDVSFARVNLPHRIAASNAPPGRGSVQAEIYHSPYRSLPDGDLLSRGMDDLLRTGLVGKSDRILLSRLRHVPFANVIYDHGREAAVSTVREWLAGQGIETCGRFGEWAYLWSDDAVHSGWNAASRVLARLGLASSGEGMVGPT